MKLLTRKAYLEEIYSRVKRRVAEILSRFFQVESALNHCRGQILFVFPNRELDPRSLSRVSLLRNVNLSIH